MMTIERAKQERRRPRRALECVDALACRCVGEWGGQRLVNEQA